VAAEQARGRVVSSYTERFLSSLIFLISIFLRPILAVVPRPGRRWYRSYLDSRTKGALTAIRGRRGESSSTPRMMDRGEGGDVRRAAWMTNGCSRGRG
jgi:hypothetical protein